MLFGASAFLRGPMSHPGATTRAYSSSSRSAAPLPVRFTVQKAAEVRHSQTQQRAEIYRLTAHHPQQKLAIDSLRRVQEDLAELGIQTAMQNTANPLSDENPSIAVFNAPLTFSRILHKVGETAAAEMTEEQNPIIEVEPSDAEKAATEPDFSFKIEWRF